MSDHIRVDSEAMKAAQQQLVELSGRIYEMNESLSNAYQPIAAGGWKGEGSEAHYQEVKEELAPAIKALEKALFDAANVLGRMRRTMREAEEQAGR